MTQTKKIGRPKLPKNETRSIMLSTRVNIEENKAIKTAINASKKAKTEWLRSALLTAANAAYVRRKSVDATGIGPAIPECKVTGFAS